MYPSEGESVTHQMHAFLSKHLQKVNWFYAIVVSKSRTEKQKQGEKRKITLKMLCYFKKIYL